MVKQSSLARLATLERRLGTSKEPLPVVFVETCDASIPDPDIPQPAYDFSDDAVVAIARDIHGLHGRVDRRSDESVLVLRKRASKLHPGLSLFFQIYRHERAAPTSNT